jgi:malate dehydrogenase (oxaloacetate-decarboxylating)
MDLLNYRKEISMDNNELAIKKHREWKGKIEIISRAPIDSLEDMAVAYTPGVAAPCLEIEKDENLVYDYTRKGNLVAVITDGTAVLGLGDIGPSAAMPVMEGKCALFKRFADIDAFPICIDSKDPKVIIETVKNISKSFGGINLEDISAPRCFEIEQTLIKECDIPVFHDDQHGAAIIAAAGLLNAIKFTGKKMGELKIVVNGAGAAGTSIAKLLLTMGFGEITMCDRFGAIYAGKPENTAPQEEMAKVTNKEMNKGSLADVIKGADVFMGASVKGALTQDMIRSMADKPIIFALANPVPEIMPDEALAAGAAIVGTGRSDFPNQVNNALCFPGIFRGVLDVRAREITDEMKVAAAYAIASVISDEELRADYILPDAFNPAVVKAVAKAVADEAVRSGKARI